MSEQDFDINESGEIIRKPTSKTQQLNNASESLEYSTLQYEIFSHPERFSASELEQKKKRYAELEQKFGKQDDDGLKKLRLKLKSEKQSNNSVLKNALLRHKQNKESGM